MPQVALDSTTTGTPPETFVIAPPAQLELAFALPNVDGANFEAVYSGDSLRTGGRFTTALSGCPVRVNTAELRAVAGGDDVGTFDLSVAALDGSEARGVVELSFGTGHLSITRPPDLPSGSDWYALIAPAAGRARALVTPVDVSGATITVSGVPATPVVVALVRSPSLTTTAPGVVSTAHRFSGAWMQSVSDWYGAIVDSPSTTMSPIALRRIVHVGGLDELATSLLTFAGTPQPHALTSAHPWALVVGNGDDSGALTLTVPCPGNLVVDAPTYGDITAGSTTVPAGGHGSVAVECAGSSSTADVALHSHSLNGRLVAFRVEVVR